MNRHLFHPIKLAKSESTSAEVAWCYMTHRVPGCPCHRYNSINIYKIIQRSSKLHQFCKTCVKIHLFVLGSNWFGFFDFLKPSKWQTHEHRRIPSWPFEAMAPVPVALFHLQGVLELRLTGTFSCGWRDRMDGPTWKNSTTIGCWCTTEREGIELKENSVIVQLVLDFVGPFWKRTILNDLD